MITILKNILHRFDSFAVVRTGFIPYNEGTGGKVRTPAEERDPEETRQLAERMFLPQDHTCRKAFL